ncbi:spore germination protein [Niallia taxi]|uniref:spore germination protein n=1 Tax=Niallia taxi TaxID=2499688 RepID=UPI0029349882|nr:spore germination protein [Niallia taxi]WOD61346.1 spore germination protein [Niallia taxi]
MDTVITKSLKENIKKVKEIFHNSSDLKVRHVHSGICDVGIIYLDGIIDTELLQAFVIKPLSEFIYTDNKENNTIEHFLEGMIEALEIKFSYKFNQLIDAIVNGDTVLLINGTTRAVIIPSVMWKERSIEESLGERSPRGPVIGLTEKLKTNVNILRSSIKTPDFCVEQLEIGTKSKTAISILYLNDIVDNEILLEVKTRINTLTNLKFLPNSRIVEDVIEGKPSTIFPLARVSERIDSLSSALYEGRVVVIIDGFPHAIIAPSLFVEFIQAPDEYHLKFGRFSIRFLRFVGFLAGIFLPGIYVAIANFHKDDLPQKITKLVISDVELMPTFWEMLILLIIIRMLIDASFRLPKSAVLLVSLIGTIVIGQTAVTAKLIHPVSLIIVGITTLSSFLVLYRGFGAAEVTLRFLMLIIGHYLDYLGLTVAATVLVIYLVSLKSVGVPYLSPLIPLRINELKDTFIRGNLKKLTDSKHTYQHKSD